MTFRVHRHEIERTVGGSFSFFLRFSFVFSEQASTRDIYSFDQLLVSHRPSFFPSIYFLFLRDILLSAFIPLSFLLFAHFPTLLPPSNILYRIYLFLSNFLASVRRSFLFYFTASSRIPISSIFSLHFLIRNSHVYLASTLPRLFPSWKRIPALASPYIFFLVQLSSSALLRVRARTSSFHRAEGILYAQRRDSTSIRIFIHVYSSSDY